MITQQQKSNLAKLLATENITVQHRKVETAYFVPKTRLLCLPVWDEMSNDLYDMLVGHEVGHALYTPIEDVQKIKEKKIPHSYYNVVEDIRIDKKMKSKYPGLKKSYFNGYNELLERDFFRLSEKDINSMRFIDRLNVYTKSGYTYNDIDFNDIEQGFIKRSQDLDTWQDVEKLVQDIFDYSKEEVFDEEQYQEEQVLVTGSELSERLGDDYEQQEQTEETTAENETDNDRESETSNEDAGYNPENTNEAITDKALEEQKKSLTPQDKEYRDNIYVTLPKRTNAVVPNKRILELFNKRNSNYYTAYYQNFKKFKQQQLRTVNYMVKEFEMKKSADAYRRTKTSRTGMLNMNKLHTYKYNEDIFKRIEITPGAKNHGMILVVDWSGSMDTAMHDTLVQTMNLVMFCKAVQIPCKVYAFTDIGKRHFDENKEDDYLGWLGNGRYKHTPYIYDKEDQLIMENVTMMELVDTTQKTPIYNQSMTYLYQTTKYFHGRRNRYGMNNTPTDDYIEEDSYFTLPNPMRLGGTPLDSAILHTIDIVNNFQKKYRVQKMTTIFLTDGVGHASGNVTKVANTEYEKDEDMNNFMADHPNGNIVIQDKQYQFGYNNNIRGYQFMRCHKPMFNYFKHKTGSQLIGFFVTSGRNLSYNELSNFSKDPYQNSYEETMKARKELKEHGVITKKNIGYDELYILPKSKLQVKDEEADITTDMSAAKMKQQFLKNFKTKRVSRVLLNKFIDKVA
jgi:hypothetical protein